MPDDTKQTTIPLSCGEAWMAFFDEKDLVNGTSGNAIDDMRQAFDAGWQAAMLAVQFHVSQGSATSHD